MRTVHEVSELTGVSIRTLRYYDKIGLLHPAEYTASGYRLYDDTALEKLQQILLFRELEFPLKDIREIMENSHFDRGKALAQQIDLLTLKVEHLQNLIGLAREIIKNGGNPMDFSAFDTKTLDAYTAQAKAAWGMTPEYKEYEERAKGRTKAENHALQMQLMDIFKAFGQLRGLDPADCTVQQQVKTLQQFISDHFYTCSDAVLSGLGEMYAAGGEFTENIDKAAGKGTAEFVNEAIRLYGKP